MTYKIKLFAPSKVLAMEIETTEKLTVDQICARHGLFQSHIETIKASNQGTYCRTIFKNGRNV